MSRSSLKIGLERIQNKFQTFSLEAVHSLVVAVVQEYGAVEDLNQRERSVPAKSPGDLKTLGDGGWCYAVLLMRPKVSPDQPVQLRMTPQEPSMSPLLAEDGEGVLDIPLRNPDGP